MAAGTRNRALERIPLTHDRPSNSSPCSEFQHMSDPRYHCSELQHTSDFDFPVSFILLHRCCSRIRAQVDTLDYFDFAIPHDFACRSIVSCQRPRARDHAFDHSVDILPLLPTASLASSCLASNKVLPEPEPPPASAPSIAQMSRLGRVSVVVQAVLKVSEKKVVVSGKTGRKDVRLGGQLRRSATFQFGVA